MSPTRNNKRGDAVLFTVLAVVVVIMGILQWPRIGWWTLLYVPVFLVIVTGISLGIGYILDLAYGRREAPRWWQRLTERREGKAHYDAMMAPFSDEEREALRRADERRRNEG